MFENTIFKQVDFSPSRGFVSVPISRSNTHYKVPIAPLKHRHATTPRSCIPTSAVLRVPVKRDGIVLHVKCPAGPFMRVR